MLLGKTCVFDGHSHFAFKLGVLRSGVIGGGDRTREGSEVFSHCLSAMQRE